MTELNEKEYISSMDFYGLLLTSAEECRIFATS